MILAARPAGVICEGLPTRGTGCQFRAGYDFPKYTRRSQSSQVKSMRGNLSSERRCTCESGTVGPIAVQSSVMTHTRSARFCRRTTSNENRETLVLKVVDHPPNSFVVPGFDFEAKISTSACLYQLEHLISTGRSHTLDSAGPRRSRKTADYSTRNSNCRLQDTFLRRRSRIL